MVTSLTEARNGSENGLAGLIGCAVSQNPIFFSVYCKYKI